MKNKHLIIVDMQVDFITGALANPNTELAKLVIQNIIKNALSGCHIVLTVMADLDT